MLLKIEGKQYSSINVGYLLLIGFSYSDDEDILLPMAKKLLELRINEDSQGKMNLSIIDIGGEILSVSQFTLYADCKKGRRPSLPMLAHQIRPVNYMISLMIF